MNMIRNATLAMNSNSNGEHNSLSNSMNGRLSGRHHSGHDAHDAESSNTSSLDLTATTNGSMHAADECKPNVVDLTSADILDHYRFIMLVRDQFMQTNPFLNSEEDKHRELLASNANFKAVFDKIKYHYKELMGSLDSLSSEAKAIMEIYKEN
jgi:hypothetical protein